MEKPGNGLAIAKIWWKHLKKEILGKGPLGPFPVFASANLVSLQTKH